MYTKTKLIDDLQNMRLQPTDTIMVHSSMKTIGPVEGGADTVVDAFMEYFIDGLHPNDKGHSIIADKICEFLKNNM